ncbi:MAG: hypothetical protein Q9190_001056 [Brigantiaea leucoxantha]
MASTGEPFALLLGTCDTKLSELLFLRSHILHHGLNVRLLDVGRTPQSHEAITYSHSDLLPSSPKPDIESTDRGSVVRIMIKAASSFVAELYSSDQFFAGIICIGGSGGTSIGSSVMRAALPVGFPKIIVSTVASGNVANFVGETDITMMNSVVDIAGQNSILDPVLENAAGMIVGAAKAYSLRSHRDSHQKVGSTRAKSIAVTMFGVTTPAVEAAREELERHGYEVIIFHVTGAGGRAMENLISQSRFAGVLDLTTTELADQLVGGTMTAGPDRLTAAAKAGIPQILSLGALDIVNFGPRPTVPSQFSKRLLYEHNPDITLLRTSVEECRTLGEQFATKLKKNSKRPDLVQVFIPKGGISMLAEKGAPFHDGRADSALFDAVLTGLEGSGIEVVQDQRAINGDGFSVEMAKSLVKLLDQSTQR